MLEIYIYINCSWKLSRKGIVKIIGKCFNGSKRRESRTIGEKSGEFCKVKQTPGRLGERSDAGQWLTPTRDSPTREERLTRVYGER